MVRKTTKNRPALFFSRTCLVGKQNKIIGFSPSFEKPKTFFKMP
jgi:hypothetical protein